MKNNKAPKLDDVARLAGVSKATVSHVLNRRGYLSQDTIRKVEQAVKDLNYHPNTVARQLYKQKTDIIGMIFPTVDNPSSVSWRLKSNSAWKGKAIRC